MTLDNTLVLHPEPRLEAVLETIQKAEAHLNAHGATLAAGYLLTASIEALMHERITKGLQDVPDPQLEIRLVCRDTSMSCTLLDNGEVRQFDTDNGPIGHALSNSGLQLEVGRKRGLHCLTLTLDTGEVDATMRTSLAR